MKILTNSLIKKLFLGILLGVLFVGCDGGSSAVNENNISKLQKEMMLPAYFYDSSLWDRVFEQNETMIVIVNLDNGVGDKEDSYYQNIIQKLKKDLKVPVGYIPSNYAQRDQEEFKAEVDRWLKFYPEIEGFFIDEVSIEDFDYYKRISEYIKSKGTYEVILNTGTLPEDNYFEIADNIVVYEGAISKMKQENICKYPQKSTIIVHGASKEQMKDLIDSKDCKFIYASDENGGRAYLTLPSYFEDEIKYIYEK